MWCVTGRVQYVTEGSLSHVQRNRPSGVQTHWHTRTPSRLSHCSARGYSEIREQFENSQPIHSDEVLVLISFTKTRSLHYKSLTDILKHKSYTIINLYRVKIIQISLCLTNPT